MKKMIIITAVLMFGMVASAQTTPTTPATTAEPVKTDVIEKDTRKVQTNPDGIRSEQPIPAKTEQPADTRAKSNEHVKSSPAVQNSTDTVSANKPRKNRRP